MRRASRARQTAYRGYNDHRFEDLPEFVARDVAIERHRARAVQPTGRSVSLPKFAFYRVDAGRIAEVWGSAFHVHLLEQLA